MLAHFSDFHFYFLLLFAFIAGFVDAVVGGGGLVQVPAFFLAFPNFAPATIFGCNKFAGFSGTLLATIRYTRKTKVQWKTIFPAIITALIFSTLGALMVSHFDKGMLKPIVLVLLVLVALYTFFKKDTGVARGKGVEGTAKVIVALLTGVALGFYDGFFGPGTGAFLIVIFVGLFACDYLTATVNAKIINCATNISALVFFIASGHVHFDIAVPVAFCNMGGSLVGVKTALKRGSRFVRVMFLIVVCGMILKFAWDMFVK